MVGDQRQVKERDLPEEKGKRPRLIQEYEFFVEQDGGETQEERFEERKARVYRK